MRRELAVARQIQRASRRRTRCWRSHTCRPSTAPPPGAAPPRGLHQGCPDGCAPAARSAATGQPMAPAAPHPEEAADDLLHRFGAMHPARQPARKVQPRIVGMASRRWRAAPPMPTNEPTQRRRIAARTVQRHSGARLGPGTVEVQKSGARTNPGTPARFHRRGCAPARESGRSDASARGRWDRGSQRNTGACAAPPGRAVAQTRTRWPEQTTARILADAQRLGSGPRRLAPARRRRRQGLQPAQRGVVQRPWLGTRPAPAPPHGSRAFNIGVPPLGAWLQDRPGSALRPPTHDLVATGTNQHRLDEVIHLHVARQVLGQDRAEQKTLWP
jgi:hypothetical protein